MKQSIGLCVPLFTHLRRDEVSANGSVHFHSNSRPVRGLDEIVEFDDYLLNPHLQVVEELVVLRCRRLVGHLHQCG